jgi:nucleotide-binding universal stress UspA family protein
MSPLQSILVHVDASDACMTRLRLARALGGRVGGSVTVLYAVTPASMRKSLLFTAGLPDESQLAYDDARLARARKRVEDACTDPGVQVEWREALDERDFTRQALYTDLVVLGPHDDVHRDAGVSAGFVPAVIIESGKPALVIPNVGHNDPSFGTVFVAWKETRESARALTAAIPFMQLANHVHLAVDAAVTEEHRSLLRRFVQRHGVDVQMSVVTSSAADVGDTLLKTAADVDAGLMVMGCYGHSRGHEWVLGGATRTILRSMTRPVLLAH